MAPPGKPLSHYRSVAATLRAHDHVKSHAAKAMNIHPKTFNSQVARAIELGFYKPPDKDALEFPVLPDEELERDKDELIAEMKAQFERKWMSDQARNWFTVKVKENKPIGIVWMGDPHVDSDGCNWPLLEKHANLLRDTPGLYGANLGDTTDNWIGRLSRLYAHSHKSRNTAIRLAEILINEMGITWLILLRGNHDMWSRSRGDDPLHWIAQGQDAPLEDWRAKFKIAFPNGRECAIHASHSFSGQSWFHPLHGNIRAALEEGIADLYISGHTHEYGVLHLNNPKRDRDYWLCKARGYKWIDHHAVVHGHETHKIGASVLTLIDPNTTRPNPIIGAFDDIEMGVKVLEALR